MTRLYSLSFYSEFETDSSKVTAPIYIFTYIFIYIYTYIFTSIHIYIYIFILSHAPISLHIRTYMNVFFFVQKSLSPGISTENDFLKIEQKF